jgi:hypothetical protein
LKRHPSLIGKLDCSLVIIISLITVKLVDYFHELEILKNLNFTSISHDSSDGLMGDFASGTKSHTCGNSGSHLFQKSSALSWLLNWGLNLRFWLLHGGCLSLRWALAC